MKCAGVEDPFTMNVLIVGYMLDSTLDYECRGYFIIQNNAGPTWGENGYGRLCIPVVGSPLTYGTCNINKSVVYPTIGLMPA